MSDRLKLVPGETDAHHQLLMTHITELHAKRVRRAGRPSGVPTAGEYQALVICIAAEMSTKRKLPHDFDSIGLFQDVIAAAGTFEQRAEQLQFLLFAFNQFSGLFETAVRDSLVSVAA